MPPTCFIFCGNFSSAPYGKTQIRSLKGETFESPSRITCFASLDIYLALGDEQLYFSLLIKYFSF